MALSRIAREFAAEIRNHDWSDSPFRLDRAGHQRGDDRHPKAKQLTGDETECVEANVMLVVCQVLTFGDPNLDAAEFAEACGVKLSDGVLHYGLRYEQGGNLAAPGE